MDARMYIFLNKGLGMSTGKAAAQAAHAAVEAYRLSDTKLLDAWFLGGHYTKLVMEADSEERLVMIERYLAERGFASAIIIDEGRTEIRPHTATALGVAVVDKDDPHTLATFANFRLYKDLKPAVTLTLTDRAARLFKK